MGCHCLLPDFLQLQQMDYLFIDKVNFSQFKTERLNFIGSKTLFEKAMGPHSRLLPGKSHGQRSLVGCRLQGGTESDTIERLHFHFPLSCIGEGNGNPLQCSCLENPRDGGAWWAAVYGVAQSRTRLKQLSSSSSSSSSSMYIKDSWWLRG